MIEYVIAAVLLTTGGSVLIWKLITKKQGPRVIEYVNDENGRLIDIEELNYRRKYVDYRRTTWDKINPVEFPGIQSYRQVVPHGIPRKGVVHFVHGYGDPLPHYSYLAKRFTDQGYEFCGIDQTGFGNSWGMKGRIESMDKCVQDLENFINLYKQRYCSQQTPIFLLGYSFGAKISTFMCASMNHCYNGVILVTPYFDVYDKEMLNQIGILSLAAKVTPNKLFPAPFQEQQLYLQDWIHNGYWTGGMISPHTALMTTVDSAKEFKSQNIMKKIAMPTLMVKSTRDHTVCGDAIDTEFQRLRALDKTLLEYDTDHFIWQDGENLQKLVCDITEWCSQRL